MPDDRYIEHHTNAVVGALAAFLHHKLGDKITAEITAEMMQIAKATKLPPFPPQKTKQHSARGY
ncbi:hypothetical protein [Ideonella sp.]|uniref:hypothetical protein n=1 Tax=Ideonella sp. TaxID=1929293 RepID=UPI0035AE794D